MTDSLHIAATGMHAQQTQIDTIANNLANVNTIGYKKSRVDFQDLIYKSMNESNNILGQDAQNTLLGLGTAVVGSSKDFSVGDIKATQNPMDVAIDGPGFFEVVLPDGSYGYTRAGSLRVNNEGFLINTDGYVLNPMVQLPSDMESMLIGSDGVIKAKLVNQQDLVEVGKIELGKFVNSSGLKPVGANLYLPTEQSGDAIYAAPGEDGSGVIRQGFLEGSNVQLVEELTNLILAQRAYEINSKVVQASDELLGIVNNLRR